MTPAWILGIESSCDETAAAVVSSDGEVASDVVHSQVTLHAPYGGVVPELASRDHLRAVGPVVREALARANRTLHDIDAIAVTCRPGLIGALLVGVQVAKAMAYAAHRPIIGVDHLVGHLVSPFLRRAVDGRVEEAVTLTCPYVALLASGGHTALYRVDGPVAAEIRELGATRDDAAGEAFDKVGKLLGLGYPGGPRIDKLAQGGDASQVTLVRPLARLKTLEFSFSGLKTQVAIHVKKTPMRHEADVANMCAAFQATATGVLVDKLVAAAKQENVRHIVVTGGVSANSELRRRAREAGAAAGLEVTVPPFASCTDNGAMIAYAGAQRFLRGQFDGPTLAASSLSELPRRTPRGRQ